MLGALVGAKTIDRFGRKFTIMACSLPLAAGWIIIAAAKAVPLFYVGRFINGMGVGAISMTVPVSARFLKSNMIEKMNCLVYIVQGFSKLCHQLYIYIRSILLMSLGYLTEK